MTASIRLTFNNNLSTAIFNWDEYSFTSDFLIPCDAFTMKITTRNDDDILQNLFTLFQNGQNIGIGMGGGGTTNDAILAGMGVKLELVYTPTPTGVAQNTNPQSQTVALTVGFVDQIEIENSRSGTFYTIRGRNLLGPICDSGIDPWSNTYKFAEGQTLIDVVGRVFDSFGINQFWLTDAVNRQITTGNNPATTKTITTVSHDFIPNNLLSEQLQSSQFSETTTKYTQYIDPTNNYDLSEKDIKKLNPQHTETYMQFVERHLARFHLHCWAMNDGSGIVIGTPDYSGGNFLGQNIINRLDGVGNNVIHGNLFVDYFSQPSIIIGKGKQGGGDLTNSRTKAARVNEFLGYDQNQNIIPSVQSILNNYKGLKAIPLTTIGTTLAKNYSKYFNQPQVPRVMYVESSKTATQHELEGILNRKMAEFQKRAITLKYTVQDHVADNGIPWKHNTIVNVDDEKSGVNGQFWVQTITFNKSRGSGTTTDLVLIPIGTIQF